MNDNNVEILKYEQIKQDDYFAYKILDFKGIKIRVYQYIMAQDILDLISSVLQKSAEDGYFSPFKVDMYTHLNLVYLASDIVFSPEDREDETALYDQLESSGLMQQIIALIPEKVYNSILTFVDETVKKIEAYNKTTAAVLNMLIQDLPKSAEAAKQIVDNFDPEKYAAVLNFAEAANGNRDIVTNEPKKPIIIKK